MERIKDERLEKAQGFCQYMYARLQENEKLKKKTCHNIALAYQRYLFSQRKFKLGGTDKEIIKMLRDDASGFKGLNYTFDNLLVSSLVVCDKLTPNNQNTRKATDEELNLKNVYDRLMDFSVYMSNLASNDIYKVKPLMFNSYEDAYNSYLKKSKLENNKFIDKSVIQAIKNNSNGSWVERKEMSASSIATDSLIASSRILDEYGYKKMKNDLNFEKEREM